MDQQTVEDFVQQKMESMRNRPLMYGRSNDALELAFIQLMEVVKLFYPKPDRSPRFIMETYHREGHKRYQTHAAVLSHTLRDMPVPEFSLILYEISQVVLSELRK